MSLTVIIPSRNDSNLAACIAQVRGHEPNAFIVVIDDGLTGKSADLFDIPGTGVIIGERPFCFARNANKGMRVADSFLHSGRRDVVLLNDDALLRTPGGFTAMQRAQQEHPEFGLLAARTNVASNPIQTGGAALREPIRETPAVAFVCVYIPRSTIDKVGLLDERFTGEIDGEMIYGGEDTAYCLSVRRAGLKVGVFGGCFVDHASLPSTFRPDGKGLPINATRKRFRELYGEEMVTA